MNKASEVFHAFYKYLGSMAWDFPVNPLQDVKLLNILSSFFQTKCPVCNNKAEHYTTTHSVPHLIRKPIFAVCPEGHSTVSYLVNIEGAPHRFVEHLTDGGFVRVL